MKRTFWQRDWFAGLAISIVFLFIANTGFIRSLERTAYDLGIRASSHDPGDKVAIIAIDDESVANIGRWPWSRDVLAKMIDELAGSGAKVIGNTVFMSEPQIDPGLTYINQLIDFYTSSGLANEPIEQLGEMGTLLNDAQSALNTDKKLAVSMREAGDVIMAMQFVLGQPLGNPDKELPEFVTKYALRNISSGSGVGPRPALAATPPIQELGNEAIGIGHITFPLDFDGGVRTESLVLDYYDRFFPSFSLLLAAQSLNLGIDDIQVTLGEGIKLGKLSIKTDPYLQMRPFFYTDRGDKPAFHVDSFFDVYTDKIPAEKYRDKIVLIGATAFGLGSPQLTPVNSAMEPVVTLAHTIASILNEDFFIIPDWGGLARMGAFLVIALYLMFLLPSLRAGMAAGITAVLLIALVLGETTFMVRDAMWLELMWPASLLFFGYLLLTTKRYLVTEKGKLRSEAESAESNRMLGLAFQQQGQLDMAFEKFRKCPLDDSIMDPLYNLALDYERKRQFSKANATYNYMSQYDPNFRDVKERSPRAKAMEETIMLGGPGSGPAAGTLVLDVAGGVEKPMLGRYQIERELGKGAMGTVYQGRDPKINRVVAIKTLPLSQEFEENELEAVKTRFFREAETAGRLTHPHIVTIYDAGEEHDLAYIAMEFLKGEDLRPYTSRDNLLPLRTVIDITIQAADALHYAHSQNVVHRDIKPGNVMWERDTGNIKLTDFGIARITDASKTKTGMVFGTPSYMSPEQLSGQKVDGRSDLFSLGVMLYQLICGSLPFQGDSMATLMYKITNEPHPNIVNRRPELGQEAPLLVPIINKALQKAVEARYQTGGELARHMRTCLQSLTK
ncbi:MAG: serine/threonine-protein kinase [Gammaproteobacteria bacterium]|nr:serine/threonine-protein kinase [Gammaproteobacteria bacterium]MCI0590862.1 serine/threonine-protein kinase [Gammaproteobacteria bacterium]